ncbi:hypothetical protein I1A_002601 [Pseudomonas fluorescens R124]|uniref:Uncharacterized protein n=1 Tax=Pseudomonas fluorescens R124 TaxID=743713 RepID=A0A7U9CMW0_PSEFL|nr:hypothetical protein I1A_002601 [Pseudomonas fluorescens R124]
MDFVYLILGAVFFISLIGLARGCAALNRRRS